MKEIRKKNKIQWKEVVLDNELLSEFTKYGVSMIEEIADPKEVSIYELKNDSREANSNVLIKEVSNNMFQKNKKSKKRKLQFSNLNDNSSNSNANYELNKSEIKKNKLEELRNVENECILDSEEYWEEYYELKEKLINWTGILDSSLFKLDKNSRDNMEELKSPELIIHPSILKGLYNLGFLNPTPIQKACLVPAIRDRKDVVGSAETGSGKTLAYGVPIVANIMFSIQRRKEKLERKTLKKDMEFSEDIDVKDNDILSELEDMGFTVTNEINLENQQMKKKINKSDNGIQALIILPSRELAIQVRDHLRALSKYTGLGIHAFVGGLSLEKQERLILKNMVQIAVGTPGRLSAFILSNSTIELESKNMGFSDKFISTNLSLDELRFLVLDEADRLVEQGHFRELKYLLQYIYKPDKNQNTRKIQTYLFSATLTLPNHLHPRFSRVNLKNNSKQSKDRATQSNKVDLAISEGSNKAIKNILQYVKLRENQVFVIDLSRFKTKIIDQDQEIVKGNNNTNGVIQLPKGLTISIIKCQSDEIEVRLLLYLLRFFSPQWETKKNINNNKSCYLCPKYINSGKILLFVNSISYVYRLVPLLSLALICKDKHEKKLPSVKKNRKCNKNCSKNSIEIIGIHGNFSQKQRIQAIELFNSSISSILICTDVLARGLDLPEIDVVIHLQPPRNVSLMIHRSGRTARASNKGECVLFCTPKDVPTYSKYLRTVSLSIDSINVPSQLKDIRSSQVIHAKQRIELANEIESLEHSILKKKKNNSWMINKANEADLELSDQEEYSFNSDHMKIIQNLHSKKDQFLEFVRNHQNY